jgi:hypothetical protein
MKSINCPGRAVVLIIGATMWAQAVLAVPNDDVRVDWSPWHAGSGGEFSVQPGANLSYLLNNYSPLTKAQDLGNGYPNNFQTFCVEEHVLFSPGDTMKASLSNQRSPDGQALPQGVAWLYNQFALGTLPGYDYNNTVTVNFAGRNDSAAALQNVIWWLFGDASDPGAGNLFRNEVVGHSTLNSPALDPMSWALAPNDVNQIPVEVLVVRYDPAQGGWGSANTQDGYRQNFLARVPDASGTMFMLAMGFCLTVCVHGRFREGATEELRLVRFSPQPDYLIKAKKRARS